MGELWKRWPCGKLAFLPAWVCSCATVCRPIGGACDVHVVSCYTARPACASGADCWGAHHYLGVIEAIGAWVR